MFVHKFDSQYDRIIKCEFLATVIGCVTIVASVTGSVQLIPGGVWANQ